MITVYYREGDAVKAAVITAADPIPAGVLWIDIFTPSLEEERSVEAQLSIQIPTREEVWRNEVLNRFYNEHSVSYMTAAVITKVDSPYPQTSAVTFILSTQHLVTMRYISPTSFQTFAQRIQRQPQKFIVGAEVLEGLLEEIITRVAHNSEIVVQELDTLSHEIFRENGFGGERGSKSAEQMKSVLRTLGMCADLNSKINESLHSVHRMLNFFREVESNTKALNHSIRTQITDVIALTRQTDFLADKITFQLDATLGMINVEQNMIIKIFSVVAVFFMPPTLVSSIYGMNFQFMPELHWVYGYPAAIGFMLICALVPYLYFRKKGWL